MPHRSSPLRAAVLTPALALLMVACGSSSSGSGSSASGSGGATSGAGGSGGAGTAASSTSGSGGAGGGGGTSGSGGAASSGIGAGGATSSSSASAASSSSSGSSSSVSSGASSSSSSSGGGTGAGPAIDWVKVFPVTSQTQPSSYASATVGAIAGDSAGNVVVAGSFFDTVNFGGADLQTAVPKSNAGYVVSLDGAGGGYRGNFKVDPGNGNFITQIVAGTGGEVVYGGAWSGNMIQGATLFGKVSAAGGSAWSGDTVGTPTGSYAGIDSIGTDSSGSLYLLDEAHQFSPNGGANGQTGPLLYKLGPAGTFQWSQLIGGYPMAVDSAGNIFCFPTSQGTLAKLDTSRNAVWAKAFSGAGATSFVVDTAGDLFIAALFASSVTYGSTTFTAHGSQDLALFKVDTNGDIVWSRAYGAAGVGMGFSNLTVDGHGDVYFVSTVAGVDFGGGTSAAPSLIVKLDPSGAYQWELSPKTAQVFIGGDSTNHLFVASADKALDLGAGPVLSTTGIAVARLGP